MIDQFKMSISKVPYHGNGYSSLRRSNDKKITAAALASHFFKCRLLDLDIERRDIYLSLTLLVGHFDPLTLSAKIGGTSVWFRGSNLFLSRNRLLACLRVRVFGKNTVWKTFVNEGFSLENLRKKETLINTKTWETKPMTGMKWECKKSPKKSTKVMEISIRKCYFLNNIVSSDIASSNSYWYGGQSRLFENQEKAFLYFIQSKILSIQPLRKCSLPLRL